MPVCWRLKRTRIHNSLKCAETLGREESALVPGVARIEVSGYKSALNELIDGLAQNITQEAKKLFV
jgi:hypothetical protein